MNHEKPNRGLFDSSTVWRINSTAMKINEAFDAARQAARDEALWLSGIARQLLDDNDRLRIANEKMAAQLKDLKQ